MGASYLQLILKQFRKKNVHICLSVCVCIHKEKEKERIKQDLENLGDERIHIFTTILEVCN